MATPIPPRRSWKYYTGLWLAITTGGFVLVVMDALNVLSRMFPDLENWKPRWMFATVAIGIFPLVILIASMIVATIVVVRKAEAINDNPRACLTKVFERMESLINTWEEGHVAGPEAHRIDVAKLYAEADDILSKHYSASEAAGFRDVKPEDAIHYPDSALARVDEAKAREFLLDAKAKFIHELMAAGKTAGREKR